MCDAGSWKSRGLQNKQAACLRLPCDVTTGQTRDEGRRERERDAHQVKTGGGGANAEPKVTEAELEKTSQMCRTYRPSL